MIDVAATLYVLGAIGQVPYVRAMFHDEGARGEAPTWVVAIVAAITVITWPVLTLADAARSITRGRKRT